MIKVKLITSTDGDPLEIASHAAQMCYQAEAPEMGKKIDVQNRLFETGHHTTLQHSFFTFCVEGISVGDITFGMHLASPFYNSDQRSGRYCAKMFLEPDFDGIEKYIKKLWPDVKGSMRTEVMEYIKEGVGIYHKNIADATEKAGNFIKQERPFVNEKSLQQNAPKIAQEQMRMFIPVIFPTGFDITLNLTALVALYESAWTPAMKNVSKEMVKNVIEKYPEIAFMFKSERASDRNWGVLLGKDKGDVKFKPESEILSIEGQEKFLSPMQDIMHPTDKLHFVPEMMDNSVGGIHTRIEISTATMGQDQRHRMIRRSTPKFTGNFYVPPILKECGLENDAKKFMQKWIGIYAKIPVTLATIIAPYGAMVEYEKNGSFNAIAHEQGKRLCWCAQEEIYHIGRLLRLDLQKKIGKDSPLLGMLEPPCYRGKCLEGIRYCGRDVKLRNGGDYFPERKV